MATVYITEYIDIDGTRQAPREPPLKEQTVPVGAVTSSAAFDQRTTLIRVHTDAICSVLVGPAATVTATTASGRMAANQTEYRSVVPGNSVAISVIANT